MRAYKLRVSNTPATADTGSVWQEVIVFARDLVGATMEAARVIEELQNSLKAAGCPRDAYETLEVDSVELLCDVVDRMGLVLRDATTDRVVGTVEEWAARIALATKRGIDA